MSAAWITVTGNLGRDAELRYLPDGTPLCSFPVAVNVPVKQNGKWEDGETMWFECSVFGDRAEALTGRLTKGTHVTVVGQFTATAYEAKDGQTRTSLRVRAAAVEFSRGGNDGERAQQGGGRQQGARQQGRGPQRRQEPSADDLPFE
jgi:single-strand DNA-binding protein